MDYRSSFNQFIPGGGGPGEFQENTRTVSATPTSPPVGLRDVWPMDWDALGGPLQRGSWTCGWLCALHGRGWVWVLGSGLGVGVSHGTLPPASRPLTQSSEAVKC